MYSEAREVTLRRDSVTMEEQVETGFPLVKKNFADIATIVKEELNISVYVEPRVVLRALWPVPEGSETAAADLLRTTANVNDDQIKLLGDVNLHGVGFSIEATTEEDGGRHLSMSVEPYQRDASQLLLELTDWRHLQLETSSVIETRIQESYDFLIQRLAPFVGSLATSG